MKKQFTLQYPQWLLQAKPVLTCYRIVATIMIWWEVIQWLNIQAIVCSTKKVTNTVQIIITVSFIFSTEMIQIIMYPKINNIWTTIPCIVLVTIATCLKATIMSRWKIIWREYIDTVVNSTHQLSLAFKMIITISFIDSTWGNRCATGCCVRLTSTTFNCSKAAIMTWCKIVWRQEI